MVMIVVVMMVIPTTHSHNNLRVGRCGQRNQEQQSGKAQQKFFHNILHFMRCLLHLADVSYRTQLSASQKRCLLKTNPLYKEGAPDLSHLEIGVSRKSQGKPEPHDIGSPFREPSISCQAPTPLKTSNTRINTGENS